MPRITVIVPVYKVEPYLRRCVDSILEQTFSDFDLVLINDASADDCGQICDEYAKQDKRVFVLHHKENLGLSAARNSGIDWAMENSNSSWLTFVDSDDWVATTYLEFLYMAAQGHDLSVCLRQYTKGETYPSTTDSSFTMWDTESFWCSQYGNGVVVWGKLYKKNLFLSVRFPIGRIYEDTYTTHKILFKYPEIPVTNQPLYYYFFNPESIVHCKWSPARLDEVYATQEQIRFFIKNKYLSIAKKRFDYFRKISSTSIKKIESAKELNVTEKKKHISLVRKAQRKALVICHRHKWCSIWNRGEDLWFYSNAFASVHVVHMIWRKLKSLFFRIRR